MVVEDQYVPRQVAVALLRDLGVAEVLQAENGRDALDQIRCTVAPLDVIICDLDMPQMDGVQFIRNVGAATAGTSIVLASGVEHAVLTSVEAMARSQGLDVLGVLEKPVTSKKLGDVLARFRAGAARAVRRMAPPIDPVELRDAIAARQIKPHFQPMVRIADARVVGLEALARWAHPERGTLGPDAFISIAERCGMIDDLTWLMLEAAIAEAALWHRAAHQWRVSVNLSLPFLESEDVADRIAGRAERYAVPPQEVVLEVTERLATTQIAPVLANIARLRMKGFRIAIDDYGTGYSSLQQLARMPFTELKVDRTFVGGSPERPNLQAILSSSMQLARRLNLVSVAEGVETGREWQLLEETGCDIAQGYLIARPMPAEAVQPWAGGWAGTA